MRPWKARATCHGSGRGRARLLRARARMLRGIGEAVDPPLAKDAVVRGSCAIPGPLAPTPQGATSFANVSFPASMEAGVPTLAGAVDARGPVRRVVAVPAPTRGERDPLQRRLPRAWGHPLPWKQGS